MFTVKQLSDLAGVTRRTLHYYDQVGLLKPTRIGQNGYRYYDEEALFRLQQILLYRELDLPLGQVKEITERDDFDVLAALEIHKARIREKIGHYERLVETVDRTIQHLQGEIKMTPQQLFEPFNEKQQLEYEEEAMQMYDPEIVKDSARRWKGYSTEEKQKIGEEGNAVYQAFLRAMPNGAASPEAQDCVRQWRKHIEYFWSPDDEQLLGLARGYNDDPRFKEVFDRIDPELAAFILQAVTIYVEKLK